MLQRKDVVVPVAILTQGRVLFALFSQLPVRALPIGGDRTVIVLMTVVAGNALEPARMRPLLNAVELVVAAHAIEGGVHAVGGAFCIDVQGDLATCPLHLQPYPPVTFQAFRSGVGRSPTYSLGGCRDSEPPAGGKQV
jgi:hypothetical protein